MLALNAGKSSGTFASGDESMGFGKITGLYLLHQKIDVEGDIIFILGKDERCLIGFVVLVGGCSGKGMQAVQGPRMGSLWNHMLSCVSTISNALVESLQYCLVVGTQTMDERRAISSVLICVGMSGQVSK